MKESAEERSGTPHKTRGAERQRAWDYLLNVLSRQSYTVAELRAKLERRKVPSALTDELLNRLLELELVDDETFAAQYVASRKSSRGRLALKSELRRKGVAEEIVDARVATLDEAQQLAAAVALLTKHAWRYRPQANSQSANNDGDDDPATAEAVDVSTQLRAAARAKSFLARRGFSPDVVVAAVERVGWFER